MSGMRWQFVGWLAFIVLGLAWCISIGVLGR
ncbi:hypothetical protein BCF74_12913 [Knoellia remsis]|uniref:Uncharacterized protein n=1 Tax=Knoellia remsis TaxID=407159 RepID=A0A2T0U4X5_9MICO|nr:hypothetical protein BCF74_12913 [Knoellia remsis]